VNPKICYCNNTETASVIKQLLKLNYRSPNTFSDRFIT